MDSVARAGGEASRRFAGRLAHEINNVLMALQGYAELLQIGLGGEPPDEMAGIRRACDRLGLLTRRLLQFGGRWALRVRDVSARELVDGLAERIAKRCAAHPGIALEVGPLDVDTAAHLKADAGALEVCADALVDNAVEAMRGTGTIRFGAHVQGAMLAIDLADSGPGMERDVLDQACEPMFTTHRERKAEGLGLSVVVGLVHLHKGELDLTSAPGAGVRATMLLPLASEIDAA